MKNKLFPLISILTLIILFGTAATCNMCGLNLTTETTTSTTEESQTSNTSTQVSETEETTKVTIAEDTNEGKTTDTTKSSSTDSQAKAPTIKLQTYEGPTYSQADKVCYYRIEAIVTGSPTPIVTFSKDDSNGAFGSNKVQVNIANSSQSYALTAKAKNSAGEATDSITLDWGCGIILAVEKTIELHPNITGFVGPNGYTGKSVAIADSEFNTDLRGRFAFDVSSLAGKEIVSANLKMKYMEQIPCDFKGNILIFYNDFLPDITTSDYYTAAYAGPETFAWNTDPLEFSNDFLKNKIAERANSNIELQFGIGYEKANVTDGEGDFEGQYYLAESILLTVTYY
jgi:hypothetical protein